MATIKTTSTTGQTLSVAAAGRMVYLELNDPIGRAMRNINVDRADFLAAVASELNVRIVPADAIVVERSELPAVFVRSHGYYMAGRHDLGRMGDLDIEQPGKSAADLTREYAAAVLALAEYLAAHPPVDEAQVTALAAVYRQEETERQNAGDEASWEDIARSLYARGVRVVTP